MNREQRKFFDDMGFMNETQVDDITINDFKKQFALYQKHKRYAKEGGRLSQGLRKTLVEE